MHLKDLPGKVVNVKKLENNTLMLVSRNMLSKLFRKRPQCIVKPDSKGVPIIWYRDVGTYRNPVTICIYALKYYNTGHKELYFNCVKNLTKNLIHKKDFSVWRYDFPWRIYNLNPNWVSSLAQGLGIKVFIIAYKETMDEKFIQYAHRCLKAFVTTIDEGGVLQIDESDGGWWYEEYASPNSIRSYVLNGHIFALEGVYDFYRFTEDMLAKKIFEQGIVELKRHLHEYDTGSWTYYDRLNNMANWAYHNTHITQMNYLWTVTHDPIFKSYFEKWRYYKTKPLARFLH